MKTNALFANPFRPGAGHMPPHLAGRKAETAEFERLLDQTTILDNLVLTGLRGIGKTVLLDTFKPIAIRGGWLWVGTDLSEAAGLSETALATRLLTDLAVVTSTMVISTAPGVGFTGEQETVTLSYATLTSMFSSTPGLVADKLKAILETVARAVAAEGKRGIIFAYDEAQILDDSPNRREYPLSLLLDVFQSVQKKDISFMLILTGLPTLFPKLVEARTFAERMFRVVMLHKLDQEHSREAITKPIEVAECPISFSDKSVETICNQSGGYPYFIQFICREVYDLWIQQLTAGDEPTVPVDEITRKLDTDFFAGRWARATDRQRDLLLIIARLGKDDGEFTVQEIVAGSTNDPRPFSASHVSQMLSALCTKDLIYKNRWGKYLFAVPLLRDFILRESTSP